MYDPTIGRWLTEDPAEVSGRETNLYRYAHNDPVNRTDAVAVGAARPVFTYTEQGRDYAAEAAQANAISCFDPRTRSWVAPGRADAGANILCRYVRTEAPPSDEVPALRASSIVPSAFGLPKSKIGFAEGEAFSLALDIENLKTEAAGWKVKLGSLAEALDDSKPAAKILQKYLEVQAAATVGMFVSPLGMTPLPAAPAGLLGPTAKAKQHFDVAIPKLIQVLGLLEKAYQLHKEFEAGLKTPSVKRVFDLLEKGSYVDALNVDPTIVTTLRGQHEAVEKVFNNARTTLRDFQSLIQMANE